MSLSGDTALVGSRLDDDNGLDSGSAYVFTNTSQSVPEPSSTSALVILGAGGAIRFGISFKRKLAKNSKKK
ncbi:hypothetical protein [Cyanothece sp. BG0011]|uniref:hypothetical protein n=1 Tax=Cyanothece sp. BG0011 TaxID=2082950 RepID=UPI000D1FD60A|nr:hypothetical protein [Cyanothece sp. BG0011]